MRKLHPLLGKEQKRWSTAVGPSDYYSYWTKATRSSWQNDSVMDGEWQLGKALGSWMGLLWLEVGSEWLGFRYCNHLNYGQESSTTWELSYSLLFTAGESDLDPMLAQLTFIHEAIWLVYKVVSIQLCLRYLLVTTGLMELKLLLGLFFFFWHKLCFIFINHINNSYMIPGQIGEIRQAV